MRSTRLNDWNWLHTAALSALLTATPLVACSSDAQSGLSQSADELKGGTPANGKDKLDKGKHLGQAGAADDDSDAGPHEQGNGNARGQAGSDAHGNGQGQGRAGREAHGNGQGQDQAGRKAHGNGAAGADDQDDAQDEDDNADETDESKS